MIYLWWILPALNLLSLMIFSYNFVAAYFVLRLLVSDFLLGVTVGGPVAFLKRGCTSFHASSKQAVCVIPILCMSGTLPVWHTVAPVKEDNIFQKNLAYHTTNSKLEVLAKKCQLVMWWLLWLKSLFSSSMCYCSTPAWTSFSFTLVCRDVMYNYESRGNCMDICKYLLWRLPVLGL